MAKLLSPFLKSSVKADQEESEGSISILELTKEVLVRGIDKVPNNLLVPEECRPKRIPWGEIPVVDLSKKHSDRGQICLKMGDAARNWGAFQVINHAISPSTLKKMESEGKDFFSSPIQKKMQVRKGVTNRAYYTGNNSEEKWHSLHWAESYVQLWNKWTEMDDTVEKQTSVLYPQGNDEYRLLVAEFMEGIRSTTELIMELLAEYLGLESNFFSKFCFPNGTSVTRWNYYPLCPVADMTLGARQHTDPNFITLLYQDGVGGLQVEKNGEWYGVRPIKEALVINIGDGFHIISNGYFKTVLHQVVVNEHSHRLSMVCAIYLENHADLSAPEQLVSERVPRLYQKIYSYEYWNLIFAGREKSSPMDASVLNGLNVLKNLRIF